MWKSDQNTIEVLEGLRILSNYQDMRIAANENQIVVCLDGEPDDSRYPGGVNSIEDVRELKKNGWEYDAPFGSWSHPTTSH
jgi:uncharacterized protein YbcI